MAWGEAPGFPQERVGPDSITATRKITGPWSGRYTKMDAIFAAGGELYPYKTAWGIRARSAIAVPVGAKLGVDGGNAELACWEQGEITIEYGLGDFERDGSSGDLFSETLEPRADFITLPSTDFRWGSSSGDPLEDTEAPGRLNRGVDYVLTFYNLASFPAAAISLAGSCNAAPVTMRSIGVTFPAQSLLFVGGTPTRTVRSTGSGLGWNLTYRFNVQWQGWNTFWRKSAQAWQQIYHAGGSVYENYPPADFSALWTW